MRKTEEEEKKEKGGETLFLASYQMEVEYCQVKAQAP